MCGIYAVCEVEDLLGARRARPARARAAYYAARARPNIPSAMQCMTAEGDCALVHLPQLL